MLARQSSLVGLAVLFYACNVYRPDLVEQSDCVLKRPFARPSGNDDGREVPLFYALKDIQAFVEGGEAWRMVGYDLDGLCTTLETPTVECRPQDATTPIETDGENGTDNAFGHWLAPYADLITGGQSVGLFRGNETVGLSQLLIRVRGWNGESNDPRVDVTLSQSLLGTPAVDGGVPTVEVPAGGVEYIEEDLADGGVLYRVPEGGIPFPAWQGDDYWWARDDGFIDGDESQPRIRDDNAYVSDGWLVGIVPRRAEIVFGGRESSLVVRITDGGFAGRLSEDASRLDPFVIFGRWSIGDILETASLVGICRDSIEEDLFERVLHQFADVRSQPDGDSAEVVCDALSFGIQWRGYAAHWGGIAESGGLPDPCVDGGVP